MILSILKGVFLKGIDYFTEDPHQVYCIQVLSLVEVNIMTLFC